MNQPVSDDLKEFNCYNCYTSAPPAVALKRAVTSYTKQEAVDTPTTGLCVVCSQFLVQQRGSAGSVLVTRFNSHPVASG